VLQIRKEAKRRRRKSWGRLSIEDEVSIVASEEKFSCNCADQGNLNITCKNIKIKSIGFA
jgi:hypothetical protein